MTVTHQGKGGSREGQVLGVQTRPSAAPQLRRRQPVCGDVQVYRAGQLNRETGRGVSGQGDSGRGDRLIYLQGSRQTVDSGQGDK